MAKTDKTPEQAAQPVKRSRYVALAALGVVGTAFFFSGKEDTATADKQGAVLYANVDECVRANVLGREACEGEFRKAQMNYLAQAPKYSAREGCEAMYGAGQCQQTQVGSSSVFVPLMVGFMVGNYLTSARHAQALFPPRAGAVACGTGMTPETQPGCVMPRSNTGSNSSSSTSSRSGWSSFSTGTGHSVSRSSSGNGSVTVPGHVARGTTSSSAKSGGSSSAAHSTTVSRGGFGSTAHSSSSRSGS